MEINAQALQFWSCKLERCHRRVRKSRRLTSTLAASALVEIQPTANSAISTSSSSRARSRTVQVDTRSGMQALEPEGPPAASSPQPSDDKATLVAISNAHLGIITRRGMQRAGQSTVPGFCALDVFGRQLWLANRPCRIHPKAGRQRLWNQCTDRVRKLKTARCSGARPPQRRALSLVGPAGPFIAPSDDGKRKLGT